MRQDFKAVVHCGVMSSLVQKQKTAHREREREPGSKAPLPMEVMA